MTDSKNLADGDDTTGARSPLQAVAEAAKSVLRAGAAAASHARSTATAPAEAAGDDNGANDDGANDDGAEDDEVIDGELMEQEPTDEESADDEPADDDTQGTEPDQNISAVSDEIPAGGAADPLIAGQAATTSSTTSDDTLAVAGVIPAAQIPVSAAPLSASPTAPLSVDYTDQGVPTLGYLRDKIEGRWGTAMGSTELAESGQSGRQQADASEERTRLAKEKLAEIRRQVDGGSQR